MTAADIDCMISSSKPTGPPIPKFRRHTPQDGFVDTIEHRGNENGISLLAQFLLESGRLVAQKELTLSFRLAGMTPIYVWNGATTVFDWMGSIPSPKIHRNCSEGSSGSIKAATTKGSTPTGGPILRDLSRRTS